MSRLTTVGVNALFYEPGVSGGSETYLRGLVPALLTERPRLRIRVYTTGRGAVALRRTWGGAVDIVALGTEEGQRLRRLAGEQVVVPRRGRRDGCDVIHSLANTGPVRLRGPAHVLTVLDVNFFTTDALPLATSLALRVLVPAAARRADGLIVISCAAREDVARELRLLPERFTVVPLGPGRAAPLAKRARTPVDDDRVVLCVAAKRPHKNQALLIRALQSLPADVSLILAGHPEAYDRELRTLSSEIGVSSRVRFVDDVSDEDLELLWESAACAVLPTRAEGFGLPLVEAMRRGIPVACSDLPVLREIGGDVPAYFDPDDVPGAAAAILAAMGARERAATSGPERASRFTWSATAAGTLEVYERALTRRG